MRGDLEAGEEYADDLVSGEKSTGDFDCKELSLPVDCDWNVIDGDTDCCGLKAPPSAPTPIRLIR